MDAGGVNSGSPKIVEQERSGVLLKLMDAMGYSLLNLTAGDIALMGKGFLKETAILSANFQGQNASFRVLREFDHTDAQGRKFRFFGAYDGPDPRFNASFKRSSVFRFYRRNGCKHCLYQANARKNRRGH